MFGEDRVVRRHQLAAEVHRLPVVAAPVLLVDPGAEQSEELGRFREFVGALAPPAMFVHQAGDVEVGAAQAVAVAPHHRLGQPLDPDRKPERSAEQVPRDRHLRDHRSKATQALGRAADRGVDVGLRVGQAESLLHHGDLEPLHSALEQLSIRMHPGRVLPGVVTVRSRDHFEEERIVPDRGRHRPGVIDVDLDWHNAGVGHQAVGRLHAVDPAEGGRHPDRTALVPADRHIRFAGGHQNRAARGRAACGVAPFVGVVDRACCVGVTAARETEALAVRLAEDGPAGVEDPSGDGGVDIRNVALEGGRAVHHRDAREHDVVLEDHGPALKLALARALDPGLVVPGVVRVLLRPGTVACGPRILHWRQAVGQLVDDVVTLETRLHKAEERGHIAVGEREPHLAGDLLQLVGRGTGDGHGVSLCWCCVRGSPLGRRDKPGPVGLDCGDQPVGRRGPFRGL